MSVGSERFNSGEELVGQVGKDGASAHNMASIFARGCLSFIFYCGLDENSE